MRIAALDLVRYGGFEDRRLEFPAPAKGAADLHLIVGPNEAGKSTLRRALADALFLERSPFQHWGAGSMALGARVELDGGAIDFERAAQKVQPASAKAQLKEALGTMKREDFVRAQAFTHDDMREAARALADGRGELHQLLVDTAAGLKGVAPILAHLQADSDAMFRRHRGNKSASLRKLLNERIETQERRDAALISEPAYHALTQAVATAEALVAQRRDGLAEVRQKLADLKRDSRAERPVSELSRIDAELSALPNVTLPPGAQERFEGLRRDMAKATVALEQAERQRNDASEALARIDIDEAALAAADEIEAALAEMTADGTRTARLPSLQDRRQRAEAVAEHARRDAGGEGAHTAETPGEVALRDFLRASARGEALRATLSDAQAALDALDTDEPATPQPVDPTLVGVLVAVDQDAGLVERAARLGQQLTGAETELNAAERAVAGDASCSEPVPLEEGLSFETAIAEATQTQASRAERLDHAQETAAKAAAARDATPQFAAVDDAALAAARQERGQLWERLRHSWDEVTADAFQAAMIAADDMADRRFSHAHELSLLAERRIVAAETSAELATAQAAYAAAEQVRIGAEERWAGRLERAGFSGVPTDYRAWRERYDALADARRMRNDLREEQETLGERIAAHCRALAPFVGPLEEDGAALQRAVVAARAVAQEAQAAAAKQEALIETWRRAQADRPARQQALAEAKSAVNAWWVDFQAACETLSVAPTQDHLRIGDVVEALRAVSAAERDAADVGREINAIVEAHEAFVGRLQGLCVRLNEPADDAQGDVAARLDVRLRAAREAVIRRDSVLATEARATADHRAAQESLRAHALELDAELIAAGQKPGLPIDGAEALARASDRRRALTAAAAERIDALADEGLAWPQCRTRIDDGAGEARRAAIEAAREAEAEAERALQTALEERTEARSELARREADAKSGTAAQETQALADLSQRIADEAHRAISLRLEIAVLTAARDALTERTQSPVLTRASTLFHRLTGGRYDGLVQNSDVEPPTVAAQRATDGEAIAINALSDGTRDQLVMALRLAAAFDERLPFIVDDLLINFDDARAARGFSALGELAQLRQVIVLTHHSHLVPVAADTLGAGVNTIWLGESSAAAAD
ncbi:MAG: AAA family ATPase [Pseudomonadota bacterium]